MALITDEEKEQLKNQSRYIAEYNRANYFAVTFRVPKGKEVYLKRWASARGLSLAAYLTKAALTMENLTDWPKE